MGDTPSGGRIHVLRPETARRIAAGEVIDRPFSVVRELIDNSIDAGATEIVTRLESGGLTSIVVSDDGSGMSSEDVALCHRSHSTSKIERVDDLDTVHTLGFRGEALSSIAAVAKLEITSACDDSGLGHRVIVRGGVQQSFHAVRARKGTTVSVSQLFHNMPARKKFLRGASAESNLSRQALLEKALPHPEVGFRFFTEDSLKLFLPPTDLVGRVAAAYDRHISAAALHLLSGTDDDVAVQVVVADPSVSRGDRRMIQVFVNGRRIWEFAFVQAVEYAYTEFLPGGRFPVGFVFLTVDPAEVDFNIHPAKKEARFRDRGSIRSRVIEIIRGFLKAYELKSAPRSDSSLNLPYDPESGPEYGGEGPSHVGENTGKRSRHSFQRFSGPSAFPAPDRGRRAAGEVFDRSTVFSPADASGGSPDILYHGQVFGLFLLASLGDTLYVVDQHAAHERILFERARSSQKAQQLLIPLVLDLNDEQDSAFVEMSKQLEELGFEVRREVKGRWQIVGIPEAAASLPEETLRELLENLEQTDYDQWEWSFYAEVACKAAVKDGAPLDSVSARELVREALSLENARCPHGRPIWFQVTREELFALVGRT